MIRKLNLYLIKVTKARIDQASRCHLPQLEHFPNDPMDMGLKVNDGNARVSKQRLVMVR